MNANKNVTIGLKYKYDEKSGWYIGIIPEFPLSVVGRTEEEIVENAKLEVFEYLEASRKHIEKYINDNDKSVLTYDKSFEIMELVERIY